MYNKTALLFEWIFSFISSWIGTTQKKPVSLLTFKLWIFIDIWKVHSRAKNIDCPILAMFYMMVIGYFNLNQVIS